MNKYTIQRKGEKKSWKNNSKVKRIYNQQNKKSFPKDIGQKEREKKSSNFRNEVTAS